jgi:hypothetical protein
MKCLSKNPAGRFAHVAELAMVLSEFVPHGAKTAERASRLLRAVGVSVTAATAPQGSAVVPALTSATAASWAGSNPDTVKSNAPRRGRSVLLAVGAAIALLAIGGGATFVMRSPRGSGAEAARPGADSVTQPKLAPTAASVPPTAAQPSAETRLPAEQPPSPAVTSGTARPAKPNTPRKKPDGRAAEVKPQPAPRSAPPPTAPTPRSTNPLSIDLK